MNRKATLLITGGSGYLGRHLCARAEAVAKLHTTYASRIEQVKAGQPHQLDLTDRQAVLDLVTHLQPQAIIHTACANPGVDEATMMAINAEGARYMAEGAAAVEARLVHVSTDALHDGQSGPYADETPPTPINTYGRSKAAAEVAVRAVNPAAAIVRTSLIYGLEEMDRGTEGFVARLAAGQPLVLFDDVLRQPVWIESLVTALLKLALVRTDFAGILNVVGAQTIDRARFGRLMLAWWRERIGPVDTSLVQTGSAVALGVAMPLDLTLLTAKAEQLLEMEFPGVDTVLADAGYVA
jgi:dTDP-4-dehydrorhamnose reductase